MANVKTTKNKNSTNTIGKLALIIAATALVFNVIFMVFALKNFLWKMPDSFYEQEFNQKVKDWRAMDQLEWCHDNNIRPCHTNDPKFWDVNDGIYTKMRNEMIGQQS